MKKILLTAILLVSLSEIFAFTTQGSWRWRKDDGSQTTATWRAAQNVPITITSTTETLRLRIELYNDPAKAGGVLDGLFFESSSDNINWDTIKTVIDKNQPFILAGTSPNVVDQEPTTQQLASPHYTNFITGKVVVATDKVPFPTALKATQGTEFEYVFVPTVNIKKSTTYFFRVDAATYIPANPLPSLTTDQSLGVSLVNFKVQREGTSVVIKWATSSEQNNDKFVIERSSNLYDWKTVATVKGNGTTNELHNYSTSDISPMKGLNYYRLKQYDLDGKFIVSDIRSLQFIIDKLSALSVFPNPVKDVINFKITDASASNVSISLMNINGKVIHSEKMETMEDGQFYKLNLTQKPAAGIYFLNVRSAELNAIIKIVIQ
ncbi:MAG: T9SS type A sorting domain-containing protein [Ginsengibacter sp.]